MSIPGRPKALLAGFALLFLAGSFASPVAGAVDPAIVKKLKNATVFVSLGRSKRAPSGSGFIIHVQGRRALVVTNAHVALRGASDTIKVVFHSGTRRARTLPARLLGVSEASDLAILELDASTLPPPLTLPDAGEVMETDEVFIVGFPFGKGFSTNRSTPVVTISRGTVSSKRLDVNDEPRLLQIDGDLNPGNSGGPIVNGAGELVGIAVSTVRQTNIGFAIPVAKLRSVLQGTLVDLDARPRAGEVEILASRLDPLARIEEARLLVGAATELQIADSRSADGGWRPVLDASFDSVFKARADGSEAAVQPLPEGLAEDQVIVGQIRIKDDEGLRYLSPFRIEPRNLAVALAGAWVHQPAAGEEAAQEKSDDDVAARSATPDQDLHDLLVKTGLDSLILKLSSPSKNLFGDAGGDSEEERTVRERLLDVLEREWDEARVRKHYMDTFRASGDPQAVRRVTTLMDLPAMQSMHFTLERFDAVNETRLASYLARQARGGVEARERMEMMQSIDELRRFSRSIINAVEQSSATIARLLNDLKPRATRMSATMLDRELKAALGRFEARTRKRLPALLSYLYKDASTEDLRDYISQLDTPPMIWFTEQEHLAFRSLSAARFASAENELLALFKSLRREMFGLEEGPSVEGMGKKEAVQAIVERYGKESVIKYLLDKNGGSISIRKGGGFVTAYGRPRKDLITLGSIARDLDRMKLSPSAFVEAMEEFQVNTTFRNRRLTANARRASLIAALRARQAGGRSASASTVAASAARACSSRCAESHRMCRYSAQETAQQCRRRAQASADRSSAYARCGESQQSQGRECDARRAQCSANC